MVEGKREREREGGEGEREREEWWRERTTFDLLMASAKVHRAADI